MPANYYPLIADTIRALPPALEAMTAALFMNAPGPVLLQQRQDSERRDALGWRSARLGLVRPVRSHHISAA